MVNGFHALIYSDDPPATRAFLRDVLDWPFVDAHGGWLIFKIRRARSASIRPRAIRVNAGPRHRITKSR